MKVQATQGLTNTSIHAQTNIGNGGPIVPSQDQFDNGSAFFYSFRTAEVLFDSMAKEFRKIKLLIEEVLGYVDEEHIPDELVDAAIAIKKLKAEFYQLRKEHGQCIQHSNIVFRTLRRNILEVELTVLSVREQAIKSS